MVVTAAAVKAATQAACACGTAVTERGRGWGGGESWGEFDAHGHASRVSFRRVDLVTLWSYAGVIRS